MMGWRGSFLLEGFLCLYSSLLFCVVALQKMLERCSVLESQAIRPMIEEAKCEVNRFLFFSVVFLDVHH